MSASVQSAAPPSSAHWQPPLSVSAELLGYYAALVSTQPLLSSVIISASPSVGRLLLSTKAVLPSSPVFHEAAALCASEDPSVCVACHLRHAVVNGRPVLCSGFARYRQLRGALNAVVAAAVAAGYGETRGLMLADWLIRAQDGLQAERTQRMRRQEEAEAAAPSLAQSFARPPPTPPTFSLSHGDAHHSVAAAQQTQPSSPDISEAAQAPLLSAPSASFDSLALSCLASLDTGPPSLLQEHAPLASAVWHALPLHLRRVLSVASLTRLLCVLELNSHELVDGGGAQGEGLFPLFALIQHSCRENCAFTALDPSARQPHSQTSSSPSVSVTCIRPISPGAALSINYAPPYLPTRLRREYLQSAYHFHCTCPLCEGELPDRCRAFVCGACTEVVWVWGEGREADGLNAWRCSNPACTAEVTAAHVSRWREAEAYLEEEASSLTRQAEAAEKRIAPSADERGRQAGKDKRKRGEEDEKERRRREQLSRLERLLQSFLAPPLALSHRGKRGLAGIAEEGEERGETEVGDDEEVVDGAVAVPGLALSVSAPPLSRSQLKNRRRRTKQRLAAAASGPSPVRLELLACLHPSHFRVHALLDLLCQARAEAGEWSAAAQAAQVRLSNVQLLCGGEAHWMEAVEWSALAALYGEMGNEAARHAAATQCYTINRACFGHDAASTRRAHSQLCSPCAAVTSS